MAPPKPQPPAPKPVEPTKSASLPAGTAALRPGETLFLELTKTGTKHTVSWGVEFEGKRTRLGVEKDASMAVGWSKWLERSANFVRKSMSTGRVAR